MSSLPTPPNEDHIRPQQGLKRPHAATKALKTMPRTLKRTSTHSHPPSPARESHSQQGDGRHKRVWKACERCRMKKTKCDGEFPCKRCKDDGLICTAGSRKKTEYKQLPPGYAEVLENTQFVLIATVQKLYSMVRNGEPWELGEPELNDRGQPIIHNVASKLGCLRPNTDLDLPAHSIFPEDEAGMAELARQLQEHTAATAASQNSNHNNNNTTMRQEAGFGRLFNRTDRASSSDVEHSDLDQEFGYRQSAFAAASTVSMSPASMSYTDFDVSPPSAVPSDGFPPTTTTGHSPALSGPTAAAATANDFSWMSRPESIELAAQQLYFAQQGYMGADMMDAAVLGSSYGMKPNDAFSSACQNPAGVMMGGNDPMIFPGYEDDQLRPVFTPHSTNL